MNSKINGQQRHNPFVSVVIPALNCADDVEGCVKSLRSQDYPEDRYEIIIVDNGSTDATLDILSRVGVRYFVRRERSRSKALNTGIANARGEIICTTDISCRPEANWIRTIVESFRDPSVGCVAGEIKLLKTSDNAVIRFQERTNYMSGMLALSRRQPPALPFADGANASFRKQLFDEIGPFEESFIKSADVEICYRMLFLSNYRMVFNRDAITWEPGEPTLKALLHQRFRMGIGANLLRKKYPALYRLNRKRLGIRQAYWLLLSLLGSIHALISANIQALRSKDLAALETAVDINVRSLMNVAQIVGRSYGRWYLLFKNIHPIPVDDGPIEKFISTAGNLPNRIIVWDSAAD